MQFYLPARYSTNESFQQYGCPATEKRPVNHVLAEHTMCVALHLSPQHITTHKEKVLKSELKWTAQPQAMKEQFVNTFMSTDVMMLVQQTHRIL